MKKKDELLKVFKTLSPENQAGLLRCARIARTAEKAARKAARKAAKEFPVLQKEKGLTPKREEWMLKNYVRLFRALSDEHRLEIIDLLIGEAAAHPQDGIPAKFPAGKMSAADLLEKFPFSQPTLSHHMKILCESNIVMRYKTGKYIHYALNISGIKQLGEFITLLSQV